MKDLQEIGLVELSDVATREVQGGAGECGSWIPRWLCPLVDEFFPELNPK